jgi:hypothetical protein
MVDLVESLAPDVTELVIAHRRSTIESAHHLVRIWAGRTAAAQVDLRARRSVATPAGGQTRKALHPSGDSG